MATVGTALTAPEAGWKRIDDTDVNFSYASGFNPYTGQVTTTWYNGTMHETTAVGLTAKFNFTGTKIRVIMRSFDDINTKVSMKIDNGTADIFNPSAFGAVPMCLVYEKTNLSDTEHWVTFTVETGSTGWVDFDAIDIDATGSIKPYLKPKGVGDTLTAPEAGWKRYDDSNILFNYTNMNLSASGAFPSAYGSYVHYGNIANKNPTKVSFSFFGTKLRLMTIAFSTENNVSVSIDGVVESVYYSQPTTTSQLLAYEKTGLPNAKHAVVITHLGGNEFDFDAIDIDSTGQLLHPDEVADPKDLVVGKRIRCNYKSAISGAVGAFSGLGLETKDFIPVASSATPDGDFYYIMVEDWNGKKRLIADRNIQHSIAWDVLNTAGIASGSGLPTYFNLIKPMIGVDTTVADSSTTAFEPDYNAYKTFDGLISIDHQNSTILSGTSGWISYNFKKDTKVNAYRVTGRRDVNYNYSPKNWTFEGWDGSTWVVLDTQMNITAWSDYLPKTFFISSLPSYSKYRINISANNGGTNTQITELEMLGVEFTANFTTRLLTGGVSNSDKDNEWDQYIVNSTLNGAITAGDNNVWNWSNTNESWTTTTNSSGNRVRRGYSSGVANWDGAGASNYVGIYGSFRPVLLIESLSVTKFLFQDGTDIKKYVTPGSGWTVVGSAPATQTMFDTDGMSDLSLINDAAIQSLVSAQPKLLAWTTGAAKTSALTAVPKDHLVMPTGDISIPAQGISALMLTATGVKVIASGDSGATWKAWNGSAWSAVTADATGAKASSMTPTTINAITPSQWNQLITSGKVRFAYYLEQAASTDIVNADSVSITPLSVATQTPSLDSLKITFDELTVEGRLQDLEKLNAINITKLNFKSNALLSSAKYALSQMMIDTFDTSGGIDAVKTTATYDTMNKEFNGSGKDVVTAVDDILASRKKLMIIPDGTSDLTFQYTLDGATWNNVLPYIVVDISSIVGTKLQVKATLPGAGSKLTGIGYSWA